jgi:hypothetical protein
LREIKFGSQPSRPPAINGNASSAPVFGIMRNYVADAPERPAREAVFGNYSDQLSV